MRYFVSTILTAGFFSAIVYNPDPDFRNFILFVLCLFSIAGFKKVIDYMAGIHVFRKKYDIVFEPYQHRYFVRFNGKFVRKVSFGKYTLQKDHYGCEGGTSLREAIKAFDDFLLGEVTLTMSDIRAQIQEEKIV